MQHIGSKRIAEHEVHIVVTDGKAQGEDLSDNHGYLYLKNPHPSAATPTPSRPTRPARTWPYPQPAV